MTPTPHSPISVGPGVDASSVPVAIEPLALEGTAVAEPDELERLAQRSHGGNCFSLNEIERKAGGKMRTAVV